MIQLDPVTFAQSLSLGVSCTEDGAWQPLPPAVGRACHICGMLGEKIAAASRIFIEVLRKEEISSPRDKEFLQAAKIIKAQLKKEKLIEELFLLKKHMIALKARGGKAEKLDWNGEENSLLTSLSGAYQSFVKLITLSPELKVDFLNWCLRDKNDPLIFISYPQTAKKLIDCNLSSRIGFYGGLRREGNDLTLPFEGKNISILDGEKEILFRGNYKLRVKEIFEIFQKRLVEIGNLEYFADGICNWNPKKGGWYNADRQDFEVEELNKEKWWESLPVGKELTPSEAAQCFGFPVDGTSWIVSLQATRQSNDHHPIGTHGWIQIAIPMEGRYRLFDFGKIAEDFPVTLKENIIITAITVPGVICYPDENIFSTNRQHKWKAFEITEAEGKNLMLSIQQDLLRGKRGELPFQFLTANCCKWAWKSCKRHLGDKLPELFQMKAKEFTVQGFEWIKFLPDTLIDLFLTLIFWILGGNKEMVIPKKNGTPKVISLLRKKPWDPNNTFFHPGNLFNKS